MFSKCIMSFEKSVVLVYDSLMHPTLGTSHNLWDLWLEEFPEKNSEIKKKFLILWLKKAFGLLRA